MSDQDNVIALNEQADDQLAQPYIEEAYNALKSVQSDLFQARKVGIVVQIPDPVRQQMMVR